METKIKCVVCQEYLDKDWLKELMKDAELRMFGMVCSPGCMEEAQGVNDDRVD